MSETGPLSFRSHQAVEALRQTTNKLQNITSQKCLTPNGLKDQLMGVVPTKKLELKHVRSERQSLTREEQSRPFVKSGDTMDELSGLDCSRDMEKSML